MAKEDLKKFRELLLSDPDFQAKFAAAAEAYKGEQDIKSVFENLMVPLGKEYGLSATYEEFEEYLDTFKEVEESELSEDELKQVAGGKDGGGLGIGKCAAIGVGIGAGGAQSKSPHGWYFGAGLCIGIGAGSGNYSCAGEGKAYDM